MIWLLSTSVPNNRGFHCQVESSRVSTDASLKPDLERFLVVVDGRYDNKHMVLSMRPGRQSSITVIALLPRTMSSISP